MKKFIAAVLLILLFAVLTGCSQGAVSGAKHQDSGSLPYVQEGTSNPDNSGNDHSGIAGEQNNSKENGEADGIITDSGRYVGQIDNNFIEIKISGVPDELAAKSFMLAYDYNEEFQRLNLQIEEVIKFRYTVNEHGQPVIFEITRL